MEVILNNQGYISSYNLTTDTASIGGQMVNNPIDLEDFEINFPCYKIENEILVKDLKKFEEYNQLQIKNQIRERRQIECFNMVDRSKFWYDSLTEKQIEELHIWYEAWLDAPETLEIPNKPEWL